MLNSKPMAIAAIFCKARSLQSAADLRRYWHVCQVARRDQALNERGDVAAYSRSKLDVLGTLRHSAGRDSSEGVGPSQMRLHISYSKEKLQTVLQSAMLPQFRNKGTVIVIKRKMPRVR